MLKNQPFRIFLELSIDEEGGGNVVSFYNFHCFQLFFIVSHRYKLVEKNQSKLRRGRFFRARMEIQQYRRQPGYKTIVVKYSIRSSCKCLAISQLKIAVTVYIRSESNHPKKTESSKTASRFFFYNKIDNIIRCLCGISVLTIAKRVVSRRRCSERFAFTRTNAEKKKDKNRDLRSPMLK